MNKELASEQLEEGEIVDDDLEDISDNSIIESSCGKFVSTNENLCALSLSSDDKKQIHKYFKSKRKSLSSKPRMKIQKKRKRRSIDSSDSDSPPQNDLKLKDKLKEAIHINGTDVNPKNSLETRLKLMSGINLDSAPETKPTECNDNSKTDAADKLETEDIEILRMEALRTAMLNRSKKRKKRKTILENTHNDKPAVTLENKENNTPITENKIIETTVNNDTTSLPTTVSVSELDEDEDILRASLLAGLAKKITNNKINDNTVNIKLAPAVLPVKPTGPPKKAIYSLRNNNVNNIAKRLSPQVKPLIITLDDDSETDPDELGDVSSKDKQKDINKVISNNVDKFLKEQRAKFETNVEKKIETKKEIKKTSTLNKSVMKLLPQSQQIEYQRLLKQLRNAELQKIRKKLTQTKHQRETVIKNNVNIAHKETAATKIKPELLFKNKINQSSNQLVNRKQDIIGRAEATKQKKLPTNELTILQKILKEIRLQKNGSLQIKEKYEELAPIVRKITVINNERKKQELHVKKLLKELNEARVSLNKFHHNYLLHIKELIKKKETIDKSGVTRTVVNNKTNDHSTIKTTIKTTSTTPSNQEIKMSNSTPVVPTTVKPSVDTNLAKGSQNENLHSTNGYEDMDVCNSDDTDTFQIDIVDPNDIDQIFRKKPTLISTVPEYISPLNSTSADRYNHVDPLGIVCPYEINGSCRDLECTFKHYLKNCSEV